LRDRADARRRRASGALRRGLHQRHDHRDPEGVPAPPAGLGSRPLPDDEHALPRAVLERHPQRAVDDPVTALARDQAGRALRDVPEDLREPALGDDADHRGRRRLPGPDPGLRGQVAGGPRQRSPGRPSGPRQADRRPARTGEEGRQRASVIPPAEAGAAVLPAPAPPAVDRRRARRKAAGRRRRVVLLCMSPWLVGFTVFFGYPLVFSAYLSFTHYDLLAPPRWIGLANYRYLFEQDQQIRPAVENTLWM